MPWKKEDAKKHCKSCDASKWATIANAVLKKCQDSGSKDCEGKAIRIANSKSKLDDSIIDILKAAFEELEFEFTEEELKEFSEIEFDEEGGEEDEIEVDGRKFGRNDFVTKAFSDVQLKEEEDEEGKTKYTSEIQILRTGSFEHMWYGKLMFDEEVFDTMIKNFNNGIPYQEFSMDLGHRPDDGAAGWIKGIRKKQSGKKKFELWFDVEWTSLGVKAIREKLYKFTSIEFTSNYKDSETGKEFGHTVLGGGLTNRPFIKKMKPVATLSDASLEIEFDEVLNGHNKDIKLNDKKPKEVEEDMKTLSEIMEEIKNIQDQLNELNKKFDEDPEEFDAEEFKNLQQKLSDATEEMSKIQKEDEEKKQSLSDLQAKFAESEKKREDLDKTLKEIMTAREEERKIAYSERIENHLSKFKELGIPPATTEIIRQILMAENASSIRVSLSSKDDEGNETTKELSLLQAVTKIVESLPEEKKIDFSTKSKSDSDGSTSNNKSLSVEEVEKYAEENKISFGEAMVRLEKEGKVNFD